MELLEAVECGDYVGFFTEAHGFVEQELFFCKVLTEVVVAEFFVDFPLVVEEFDGCGVGFPEFGGVFLRYVAYGFELGLEFFDALVLAVDVVGVGADGFELVDYGAFALAVLELLFGYAAAEGLLFVA